MPAHTYCWGFCRQRLHSVSGLAEKRLVRVGDDLVFHQAALEKLRGMLAAHKSARFSVPVFKDWTGISRKYAIPLLEYLDRERVTRRDGDERVVL